MTICKDKDLRYPYQETWPYFVTCVLQELATATHGFSSAKIESCVSESPYNWAYEREQGKPHSSFEVRHIQQAIQEARPLSVLVTENIEKLRE